MVVSAPPLSILLVDDHADSLFPLARLLRHCGHEVRTAASVAEGVAAAADRRPDLLVSDIVLPDGDGCDLLRRVRETMPGVKGVAVTGLTGLSLEQFLDRCRLAGFEKFLAKPVLFQDVMAALRQLFPAAAFRSVGGAPPDVGSGAA